MKTVPNRWQYLLASLYACTASAFFGAILLDILYAHALSGNPDVSNSAAILSQAADLLLLLGIVTFLAGFGAIGATWNLPSARNLFIASLAVFAVEFLIPPLFGQFLRNLQANYGLAMGTWIRLLANAMSATLAFAALFKLYRSGP